MVLGRVEGIQREWRLSMLSMFLFDLIQLDRIGLFLGTACNNTYLPNLSFFFIIYLFFFYA